MSNAQATAAKESGEGKKVMRDWQKERLELAEIVNKHVLDPITTFAELVRGYDHVHGIDFNMEEISEVLRLLVIVGRIDMATYCIEGGMLCHMTGKDLEGYVRDWADMTAEQQEAEE